MRWLLLTHHLPAEPAYLRVKVRRRLERIGAVPLKSSVYALPPGEDTREDFEWLAQEIGRNRGEASLCMASFLDGATDERLLRAFRDARASDYGAIAKAAADLIAGGKEETMGDSGRFTLGPGQNRLRRRLANVIAIDFFNAPGRAAAERAIARLGRVARGEAPPGSHAGGPVEPPSGATWVTRRGVKVDRMASVWLIRRFIDPGAVFRFVAVEGYAPAARELRFDMFGGEFTHDGEACTFETLLDRFALDDPALAAIAEVVHDLDCKDDKFGRAEAEGIGALLHGITLASDADEERIERSSTVLDGLYEHFGASPP